MKRHVAIAFLVLQCAAGAAAPETALLRAARLRAAVEDYCASLPRREGEEIVLECRDVPDSVRIPAGSLRLSVDAAATSVLRGHVSFAVEVAVEGVVVRRILVAALVRTYDTVLVATRPLAARALVGPDDVRETRVETTQWIWRPVTDRARLAGRRAKRIIGEGSALCEEFLEEVPLVQHGEFVTLRAVAGGVSVATGAVALEDGCAGSVILVRAERAHDRLRARVTGPGQVQALGE